MDTAKVEAVVRKSLANAEAAEMSMNKRIEHAVRSVMQVFPTLSQDEAVTAVRRVQDKMAAGS